MQEKIPMTYIILSDRVPSATKRPKKREAHASLFRYPVTAVSSVVFPCDSVCEILPRFPFQRHHHDHARKSQYEKYKSKNIHTLTPGKLPNIMLYLHYSTLFMQSAYNLAYHFIFRHKRFLVGEKHDSLCRREHS